MIKDVFLHNGGQPNAFAYVSHEAYANVDGYSTITFLSALFSSASFISSSRLFCIAASCIKHIARY